MSSSSGGTVWSGVAAVKGSDEWTRMALLTFCLIGLQFTWGMEMTYCTPYLLDLGLTKSRTSLVWIAGPLSGMIMAPAIGAIADRSKSRYGRRRPYMVGGSILVILCLFTLGWAREIVTFFFGTPKSNPTIVLAVVSIYALDFAINAVQWSCRGLIVDTLPSSKQQTGSAWAARMISIGHLVGYAAGAADLEWWLGNWFGNTQFKRVTVVAAVAMGISTAVTSWAVSERVLISEGSRAKVPSGPLAIFLRIVRTMRDMPPRVKSICWCQFWQWVAWFPFLFYSATWVGEVYMRYDTASRSRRPSDMLGAMGKIGSTTLIVFSAVTFTASCILPSLIRSPEEEDELIRSKPYLHGATPANKRGRPSLLSAWFASQFIYAAAMGLAPLVRSLPFASLLVAICGIPQTFTSWASFSFMGLEIARLERSDDADQSHAKRFDRHAKPPDPEKPKPPSRHPSDLSRDADGDAGLAGVYLGIFNLYTTSAQMVGTFISTIVFSVFEPGKSAEFGGEVRGEGGHGTNAISVCLFVGAGGALAAAFAIRRLGRMM